MILLCHIKKCCWGGGIKTNSFYANWMEMVLIPIKQINSLHTKLSGIFVSIYFTKKYQNFWWKFLNEIKYFYFVWNFSWKTPTLFKPTLTLGEKTTFVHALKMASLFWPFAMSFTANGFLLAVLCFQHLWLTNCTCSVHLSQWVAEGETASKTERP